MLTIRLLKLCSLLLNNAFQLGFLALLGFLQCRQLVSQGIAGGGLIDGLLFTPAIQTDARRQLNDVERRVGTQSGNTPQAQAQNLGLQAESARLKALVDELELAQLSANNRQELARMRSELAQKQSEQLDAYLQALRNLLNSQRQREAERALESTELLAENSANLPEGIVDQFKVNRELSAALNQQAQRMDLVASQQRQATNQTLHVVDAHGSGIGRDDLWVRTIVWLVRLGAFALPADRIFF